MFAKFYYVTLLRSTLEINKIWISKLILLVKALKSIPNIKKFKIFYLNTQGDILKALLEILYRKETFSCGNFPKIPTLYLT